MASVSLSETAADLKIPLRHPTQLFDGPSVDSARMSSPVGHSVDAMESKDAAA